MNWLLFIFITGWSGHHTSLEVIPFESEEKCNDAMWKLKDWHNEEQRGWSWHVRMRCIHAEE